MEETHNIRINLNVVMAVHILTEEEKENMMRTKRVQLNLGIWAENRNGRK